MISTGTLGIIVVVPFVARHAKLLARLNLANELARR